jgi:hypothetical protein
MQIMRAQKHGRITMQRKQKATMGSDIAKLLEKILGRRGRNGGAEPGPGEHFLGGVLR